MYIQITCSDRKKTDQKKIITVIMVSNIPKLMINNITDPERSENTEKTKYFPPPPPKKKLHPGIYLNYVKAKTENIEKAKCEGGMDITDKRAEELE